MAERDPYLDQLAQQVLEADTLEEKVFLMQVFYERLIIPRFRMIASSSRARCSKTSATGSRSTTASITAAGMA